MTDTRESNENSDVPDLKVLSIADAGEMAALVPEWEALDNTILPRTPFTSYLWNSLWWKHLRARQLLVRDDFFVHVVRDGAGRLVAVAPMMLTRRPAIGPLRFRSLQFFGADRAVTELRGIACAREVQDDVVQALGWHLIQQPATWDWIEWSGLHISAPDPSAPPDDRTLAASIPLYYLPLPSTWDELRARLPRNTKESLRKCYNALKRAGYRWTFRVVQSPADVTAALGRFFELHGARARTPGTVAHLDVFRSAVTRDFLSEYCRRMAERGALYIFQLDVEGEIAATRIGFLLGEDLYLYYSGYDPRWAKLSVMTTVLAEAIQWAIERRLRVVNLSTGRDLSKLRWRPQCALFGSATMTSPTISGPIAFRAYESLFKRSREDSVLRRVLSLARRAP